MRSLMPLALVMVMSHAVAHAGDLAQCTALEGHADKTACFERLASQASEDVEKADESFRTLLNGWDQEGTYRKNAVRAFNISALSFKQYQKDICTVESSSAFGGDSAGDIRARCVYRTAQERVQLLKEQQKLFVR